MPCCIIVLQRNKTRRKVGGIDLHKYTHTHTHIQPIGFVLYMEINRHRQKERQRGEKRKKKKKKRGEKREILIISDLLPQLGGKASHKIYKLGWQAGGPGKPYDQKERKQKTCEYP